MLRSRTIIVVSHCVLNQNTVIPDEARSTGVMKSAVDWCHEQGYGVLQLPCPEFTYLGPDRPSMTRQQYDTPEYREHCRNILQPIIDQLQVYVEHNYQIAGGLGIAHSPSCDPGNGVFMEEFLELACKASVKIEQFWQIPATEEGKFNPNDPDSIYGR